MLPLDGRPVIVDDKKVNKPIATEKIELPSNLRTTDSGMSLSSGVRGERVGDSIGQQKIVMPKIVNKNSQAPVETADIMPQNPGGIKALLAFLKNNIHAPVNVDEGEVVSVKIKFQ